MSELLEVAALPALSVLFLGFVLGPVIDRSGWADTHPGSAALFWVGAVIGTVCAVLGLVVIALLSPPAPVHGLLDWADHCLPHHGLAAVTAASAGSALLVWACWARLARGVPRLRRAARHRRHHREMLGFVAREDEHHDDVLILDHPLPVAYCMRARSRPIVLTTGALDRLSQAQIGAVLAHERAHLRHRHHLMLSLVDVAYAMLPWLPTLRGAQARVPQLLEMAADDSAARRWGHHAVIDALRRLTLTVSPPGTLAATGDPAGDLLEQRVARLRADRTRSRALHGLALLTSATTVGLPLTAIAVALADLPLPC
jgi:Zn-dependent protease with chaperone function